VQFGPEDLFKSLRNKFPELQAVVLIGAAGTVRFHAAPNLSLDLESFAAEYSALYRIALRTAQETAMGDAFEQILISNKSVLLVRRFGPATLPFSSVVQIPNWADCDLKFEIWRNA
jgi:predicted regulator of Ras-like GTPase activity (Roadblock/LC7/MglB family)